MAGAGLDGGRLWELGCYKPGMRGRGSSRALKVSVFCASPEPAQLSSIFFGAAAPGEGGKQHPFPEAKAKKG